MEALEKNISLLILICEKCNLKKKTNLKLSENKIYRNVQDKRLYNMNQMRLAFKEID